MDTHIHKTQIHRGYKTSGEYLEVNMPHTHDDNYLLCRTVKKLHYDCITKTRMSWSYMLLGNFPILPSFDYEGVLGEKASINHLGELSALVRLILQ